MFERWTTIIIFHDNIISLLNWFHNFCSIGNFFFAGARTFFQSLDAAIFLFSRVSDIPSESLVLPVISTNDRLTLGCELWVWLLTYNSCALRYACIYFMLWYWFTNCSGAMQDTCVLSNHSRNCVISWI